MVPASPAKREAEARLAETGRSLWEMHHENPVPRKGASCARTCVQPFTHTYTHRDPALGLRSCLLGMEVTQGVPSVPQAPSSLRASTLPFRAPRTLLRVLSKPPLTVSSDLLVSGRWSPSQWGHSLLPRLSTLTHRLPSSSVVNGQLWLPLTLFPAGFKSKVLEYATVSQKRCTWDGILGSAASICVDRLTWVCIFR